MVECRVCKKEFKAIVEFHLKYHNMTFKDYRKKYPKAPIIDPYNCENCQKRVTTARSKRGKYCKDCAKIIKHQQIIENARRHNRMKRRMLEKAYTQANLEYGMSISEDVPMSDRVRVDSTHSAWDHIPNLQDVKGTFNDQALELNKKTGRVKQAEWLRREIKKMKQPRKF